MHHLPTLGKVVADNMRRLRDGSGLRQDDLARRSRMIGLDWTPATVAAIETDRRAVALDEAPLLAIALGCRLAELFEGDDAARLGARAEVDLSTVRDLMRGADGGKVRGHTTAERQAAGRELQADLRRWRRLWPKVTKPISNLERAEDAADGEAERKAARRLGVDAVTVSVAAHGLWGRSLTEERDERAGPDPGAAKRGHVTRALLEELEAVLERKGR